MEDEDLETDSFKTFLAYIPLENCDVSQGYNVPTALRDFPDPQLLYIF